MEKMTNSDDIVDQTVVEEPVGALLNDLQFKVLPEQIVTALLQLHSLGCCLALLISYNISIHAMCFHNLC